MSNLPLHDINLNVEKWDIFRPIDSILPYNLPKLDISSTDQMASPPPSTKTVTSTTNPATATSASKASTKAAEKKANNDTYCKACKKKFSNAATFDNHLKSAKHIANEKKLTGSKAPDSTKVSTPPEKVTVNPQVQEALQELEKAKSTTDPLDAMSIYWSQAQILFKLQRPRHVFTTLKLLVDTLDQPAVSTTTTSFRYSSQLALSRLHCLYQQVDTAQAMYLQALETKWEINTNELLQVARQVRTLPLSSLLLSCEALVTQHLARERSRTQTAAPLTDPNDALTAVLKEAANLFAQDKIYEQMPCAHVAIVLYGICSLICPFEQHSKPEEIYDLMSQVYKRLGLTRRVIELKLLDKENTWNLFEAMLLSLESDDVVLARNIQQQIVNNDQPDIMFLCHVLKKKIELVDVDLLQELKYIELLIQQSMVDMLYIGNQTKETQASILSRFEQLIMI